MHLSARPAVRLGALALTALLAAGCSSDELDVEGFAPGACTEVAPALQDLDRALTDYASDDLSGPRAAAEFEATQDELLAASADAEAPVREAMAVLVSDLGFLRIATDNDLDDTRPQEDARAALDALAQRCGASDAGSSGY